MYGYFLRPLNDDRRLGYVFVYLKENLKNDVFRIAERNSQFALGFGVGLSNLFTFMNEDFRNAMFKKAEENTQFTRGLGIGLGKVFSFLDKEFQSKLFAQAQKDVEFAIGLGEGFGHIFVYLKKELRNKILEDLSKQSDNENGETSGIQDNNNRRNGNGFNRGLGIGLGKTFPYVMKDLEFRIFAKAAINTQFAIGLGEGFGHIFSYVDNELQDRILQKSNERSLARGLGIGLSHVLHYFNNKEELQNRIFKETDTNKVLAKSLGSCLNFSWLKRYNLLEKILTKAEQNSEFAEGICMKEDFDNDVKLLNKESQDVCKHLVKKCGYNENKFSFNDYPIIGFPSNTSYHCTNQENGVDQNVIDDEMKEYLQMVLDEMKNKNKNDKNV